MPNIAKPFCFIHDIPKIKNSAGINICWECRKEYKRQYVLKNKEELAKKRAEYSRRTREKSRDRLQNDRKNNPQKYRYYDFSGRERQGELYRIKRAARPWGLTVE